MTPTTPAPISDQAAGEPIPMLLFCPKCHSQHIDSPKWERDPHDVEQGLICTWNNPPHKSHLCHACGNIWRPADVETTGVASIKTKGKADTWDSTAPTTGSAPAIASGPCFIVKGSGETDLPVVHIVYTREAAHRAVLTLMYSDPDHADPEDKELLDDLDDTMADDNYWSIAFEIGGISVERVCLDIALLATSMGGGRT
jgi:hypothetical protein